MTRYDLLVIGSGRAGRGAAIQAAKLGGRVAIVERGPVGGAATNTRALPFHALRAAAAEVAGQRGSRDVTIDDLQWRTHEVVERERDAIVDDLRRNGIDLLGGSASFVDAHTLAIAAGDVVRRIGADRFVIAVGTIPSRPCSVDFDDRVVIDSDGPFRITGRPRTMTVVGAGVVGLEYASVLAALGARVTLVERRSRILDFVDHEIAAALQYHLRGLGVTFRLGEELERVERDGREAVAYPRGGRAIRSDGLLYAGGRRGATAGLGLAAAGLEADARGRLPVGPDFRTAKRHILGAGDVIGSRGLAAASMEQGRLAALTAFDRAPHARRELLPCAIYTIPEISFIGRSELRLTADAMPFVVGLARFRELARGDIAGDRSGLLKLLVHAGSRRLLGVHIFGTAAAELLHLAQTVMAADLPVDYLADAVFNEPTFTQAYRVAALDAAHRLDLISGNRPPRIGMMRQ